MNQLMRLRYNPFHAYLVERVQEWLGALDAGTKEERKSTVPAARKKR